jgi:hypothetical protein
LKAVNYTKFLDFGKDLSIYVSITGICLKVGVPVGVPENTLPDIANT